jgi:hypothetical protein
MPLLRVRFTIRRLMTVVAAIAIILGLGAMLYRGYRYRRIAEYHRIAADLAAAAQKVAVWKAAIDERFNEKSAAIRHSLLANWIGRMGRFHSELRRKYAQAAWTPWRFPDLDPAPPQQPAGG